MQYMVEVNKDEYGKLTGSIIHQLRPLNNKTQYTEGEFNKLFEKGNVKGDGNCFFTSLSNLRIGGVDKDAATYRKEICDFYKDFNKKKFTHEYTLEHNLKTSLLGYDSNDPNHTTSICGNTIYADGADVIAASLLYETNINVYSYNEEQNIYVLHENGSNSFTKLVNIILKNQHYDNLIYKKNSDSLGQEQGEEQEQEQGQGQGQGHKK